jgi:hypothetical protein
MESFKGGVVSEKIPSETGEGRRRETYLLANLSGQ